MKRSQPLRRGKPLRNRGRLNQRSTKRVDRDRAYVDVREQVASRYWCEAAGLGVCQPDQHRGDHAHHVVLRSRGGEDSPENMRFLCAAAHLWVHNFPRLATELGLMASRG